RRELLAVAGSNSHGRGGTNRNQRTPHSIRSGRMRVAPPQSNRRQSCAALSRDTASGAERSSVVLRVDLIGNLGTDPQVTFSQKGNELVKLNVAINQVRTDPNGERQESTEGSACEP